jgi:hypothetical protein
MMRGSVLMIPFPRASNRSCGGGTPSETWLPFPAGSSPVRVTCSASSQPVMLWVIAIVTSARYCVTWIIGGVQVVIWKMR